MRDMLNKLDFEKKRIAQLSRAEIGRLQDEVRARDKEIHELQNATIVIDTERIWDLENQVDRLKRELQEKQRQEREDTMEHDWTMAARGPYTDEYTDMIVDDDHFGNDTMAQLGASTPSRARSSFPTPPATSPTVPATPCSLRFSSPNNHVGVQAVLPDEEKCQMEEEVASLQLEVSKLTATLESYKTTHSRMASRLSSAEAAQASGSELLDNIEKELASLMQSVTDKNAALSDLAASILKLGFPGNEVGEMIASVSSGFRAARLELEYLTPGELTLPLTSHGAEVLDLLLTRLRELASKSKEDDSSIDEYHQIEQSLRKQLDARVSAMDALHAELTKAKTLLAEKNTEVEKLKHGNSRFQGAIKSYIRDISELEALVDQLDKDRQEEAIKAKTQQDETEEELAIKNKAIDELDRKMLESVKQTEQLLQEISDLEDHHVKRVAGLNKQHGQALALRDARVMELRVEIDRVNESIRTAHESIRVLRVQNGALQTKMAGERLKAKQAIDSMKAELERVLEMGNGFLDSPKREAPPKSSPFRSGSKRAAEESDESRIGSLAPRESNTKKARRRPDSGLGLLEEDNTTF